MELTFSKGDLLAGQSIEPNWYKGTIVKEEFLTREGVMDYKITLNFDDPKLAEDDRFVETTFFTVLGKGRLRLIPYMAALQNKTVTEITDAMESGKTIGFEFGEGQNQGKKIQFKLINEPYQGRVLNKIETFLPYSAPAPQIG